MKSLVSYITESSSKYINKLRKFLEPAFKSRPDLFINPDVFYPSGIGKIEDLALIQTVGDEDNMVRRSTDPIIGVGKYNGKVYVVVRYDLDITRGYKIALLDSGTTTGQSIPLISDGMASFMSHILNIRPVKIMMNVVDHIDGSSRSSDDRVDMDIELFSIDWKVYNKLYKKMRGWEGNMDELRSALLKRKTILSELEEWYDELVSKVTWYAKNTDAVKTVRKKPLKDDMNKFADQMLELYNKIKTSDSISVQEMNEYKYFFDTLYLNVEQPKGVKNKNIVMVGERSTDTVLEFTWVIGKPYRIYGDYGSEAPSFKMDTKCPTLLNLLKVLYQAN